jgi:hypothetical protein
MSPELAVVPAGCPANQGSDDPGTTTCAPATKASPKQVLAMMADKRCFFIMIPKLSIIWFSSIDSNLPAEIIPST